MDNWSTEKFLSATQPQQTLSSTALQTNDPSTVPEKRLKKQTQPRQLLSCTKCRERKAKVSLTGRKFVHMSYLTLVYSVTAQSHALLVVLEDCQRSAILF
jgi:hypothetical protein